MCHEGPVCVCVYVCVARRVVGCIADLGHTGRTLHVLKVDIEGSEYSAFEHPGLFGGCMTASAAGATPPDVRQVQIEVHGTSLYYIFQLMERMQSCGLAIFNKEPNHWGCDGYKCVELSLVSPEHAFNAFALTHPSCTIR